MNEAVTAVQELHSSNRAHADIRLDKICFEPATKHAVLIDLDRSCLMSQVGLPYANSTMYTRVNSNWTAENVDWRQLAIMIFYILSPGEAVQDYHQIEIDSSSHPFISTMFCEGNT